MSDESAVETRVSYSAAMTIDQRAAPGTSKDELVALAKDRALDPSIFDQYDIFTFSGEMTSSRWDSYDTRMGATSLKNYAAEAAAGVSYLMGHDTRSVPVGQTLTGDYTGAQGNGIATVRSSVYMLNDPSTAPIIAKIRAGIVRDQSIGFSGGEWMCSICGRDMQQWFARDGCPHLLGMTYTPKDEAGKQQGEPVKARATIENAHLHELSGVYEGATPGAMIDKARALDAAGMLDTRLHDLVQVRYRMRLPDHARLIAVPDVGALRNAQQEEDTVEPEVRIAELETRIKELETKLATASKGQSAFESARALLTDVVLPENHEATGDLNKTLRFLADERTRLAPLADDGVAYRRDLIAGALAEGVRAYGNDFQKETYQQVMERAPLDTIKRMQLDWKQTGDKNFPGGRQSADADEHKVGADDAKASGTLPAEAYRVGR